MEKLEKFYEAAGTKTQLLCAPLLKNATFMSKQLDMMRKELKQPDDWVTVYRNGSTQHGTTSSALGKSYTQLMKTFMTSLKTLKDLLPDDIQEREDDFTEWLNK